MWTCGLPSGPLHALVGCYICWRPKPNWQSITPRLPVAWFAPTERPSSSRDSASCRVCDTNLGRQASTAATRQASGAVSGHGVAARVRRRCVRRAGRAAERPSKQGGPQTEDSRRSERERERGVCRSKCELLFLISVFLLSMCQ